mmetsp:Transcript_26983/g.56028  ORF Transcript_26983/g.56028 Transcript_26983/m.56028 type:complete len:473 (-) Transcript_26983:61-1479(-)
MEAPCMRRPASLHRRLQGHRHRWYGPRVALVVALAALGVSLGADLAVAVPKEAEIFRSIETKRKKPLAPNELPRFYGRHPNPTKVEELPLEIPGNVQQPTRRESMLRAQLKSGEMPTNEEFERPIQVFSTRARQDVKYLSVQRREFNRRAKNWAREMIVQGLEPSTPTLQMLMLGCAAVGDGSGTEWYLDWMMMHNRPLGRLEYNAVIGAYGVEGEPMEARKWLDRMREAGIAPDAKSYAGIVEAWERIGNRKRMLEALLEMRQAEAGNELGDPLDPRHAALPYYAMARSYVRVADSPRALALLKHLQAKKVPLTHEAHKLRLEVHLRTPPGPRRSLPEIERAFRDLVRSRPKKSPIYSNKLGMMCRYALGSQQYEDILKEHGTSDEEVVADIPSGEATRRWRRANIQAALEKHKSGREAIQKKREDQKLFRKRLKAREGAQMGKVEGGYRVAGQAGLPEWMTLPAPEKFGY